MLLLCQLWAMMLFYLTQLPMDCNKFHSLRMLDLVPSFRFLKDLLLCPTSNKSDQMNQNSLIWRLSQKWAEFISESNVLFTRKCLVVNSKIQNANQISLVNKYAPFIDRFYRKCRCFIDIHRFCEFFYLHFDWFINICQLTSLTHVSNLVELFLTVLLM